MNKSNTKIPNWIRVKLPISKNYHKLQNIVDKYQLNTICQSGNCPNIGECWGNGIATFMILGNICTRSCRFCNVKTGRPKMINWNEPEKVAFAIKKMNIKHAVITSVNRDDLEDMGSLLWINTIKTIRYFNPFTTIETLIPDFKGKTKFLDKIINTKPEVISHNLETVRRLTKEIRIQAKYDRSLELLRYLKTNGESRTKTGIMLGLGETEEEILETMEDIKKSNVDIITIGQYLQPSKQQIAVRTFISPEKFKKYENIALKMGFMYVESGALVRSSYHADRHVK
ncbi:MAG: lipoyl synthase [Candidatus Bostrichicola ureolyticus]|nr:MAG: lipoyl synthase [Candidatus Bostrichicola ureolyticus]